MLSSMATVPVWTSSQGQEVSRLAVSGIWLPLVYRLHIEDTGRYSFGEKCKKVSMSFFKFIDLAHFPKDLLAYGSK